PSTVKPTESTTPLVRCLTYPLNQPADIREHSAASAGIGEKMAAGEDERRKPKKDKPLGNVRHPKASFGIRVGEGTRTPDIQSHRRTLAQAKKPRKALVF